jgi:hypothetical protein
MLSYKDMTFCSSDCKNEECFRHFGTEQKVGADKWWATAKSGLFISNTPGSAPIAFSDFSYLNDEGKRVCDVAIYKD